MELNFLPKRILDAILGTNYHNIYEIRLRLNYPVKISVLGEKTTLKDKNGSEVMVFQDDLTEVINNVTENSIYAFNDKILKGFITTKDGVRVGLSGEIVVDNGKIITLKNFTSLNIRLSREVFGASDLIYTKVFNEEIYNTLIVAPPFSGKTTILKDLIRRINIEKNYDVLVIDERGEFYNVKGENVDVIRYGDKTDTFLLGLRSLSPDVIIMDELATEKDFLNIEYALSCGVKIIATIHGENKNDLIKKPHFNTNLFERYVFIKKGVKKGVIDMITDNSFDEI